MTIAARLEMGRRAFGRTALGLMLAGAVWSGAAQAQTPPAPVDTPATATPQAVRDGKPFRIMMVLFRGKTDVETGFREYLANAHIPVELIVRDIERDRSRLPGIVEEIRRTRPDLVYTWGTPVTLGIVGAYDDPDRSKFINDIPVVFALVADPVGTRIVPSLEKHGRNVTGVTHLVPLKTQMNAIAAYRPFTRLGVVYNPAEQNSVANVKDLQALGREMGFEVLDETVPLDQRGEPMVPAVAGLVTKVAKRGAQFLYIGPDTFIGDQRDIITQTAMSLSLPVFTATELEIRTSRAMLGLVSRYHNVGRFAAFKAEQILVEHVAPQSIAVETLKRFSYIVRMDVARELHLYPPMSVLKFAEVID